METIRVYFGVGILKTTSTRLPLYTYYVTVTQLNVFDWILKNGYRIISANSATKMVTSPSSIYLLIIHADRECNRQIKTGIAGAKRSQRSRTRHRQRRML